MANRHTCSQRTCSCAHVEALTRLYRQLKQLRKQAKKTPTSAPGYQVSQGEIELLEQQYASHTETIRGQRAEVRGLMTALRELSGRLAGQEEEISRVDREIEDLQNEICIIKKKLDDDKCHADVKQQKSGQIDIDDTNWRQTVALEIQERNRLQDKIKRMSECLEEKKFEEKSKDTQRQEQRKEDSKFLLNAIDYVDKYVEDTEAHMCNNFDDE